MDKLVSTNCFCMLSVIADVHVDRFMGGCLDGLHIRNTVVLQVTSS